MNAIRPGPRTRTAGPRGGIEDDDTSRGPLSSSAVPVREATAWRLAGATAYPRAYRPSCADVRSRAVRRASSYVEVCTIRSDRHAGRICSRLPATLADGYWYGNRGAHMIRLRRGRITSFHAYLDDGEHLAETLRHLAAQGVTEAAAEPILSTFP
jgi:ketosteroid isomerase-like protein